MKLRNKETGEIGELLKDKKTDELFVRTSSGDFCYNSLTELCKEWEDYGKYYYTASRGEIYGAICGANNFVDDNRKEIGNYFETNEEAELAVKKLKAWKKLKDAGFRFDCYDQTSVSYHDGIYEGRFVIFGECDNPVSKDDVDLLFGDDV